MPDHRIDYVTAQRDYDEMDDPTLGDDGGDADETEPENDLEDEDVNLSVL